MSNNTETQIEDILSTLCTEVSLLSSNDTQLSYRIAPKHSAYTVHDVFNTCNFDVKIYEDSDSCRVYLNRSDFMNSESNLNLAKIYAETCKNLSHTMDSLSSLDHFQPFDYSVNIENLSPEKKQIIITLNSAVDGQQTPASPQMQTNHQDNRSQNVAAASKSFTQSGQRKRHGMGANITNIENTGVPKIAKTYLMQDGPNKGKEKGAHWRWLYTHVFRHFTENAAPAIALIIILLSLTSFAILMKGFFCPDFATAKKLPWYCSKENIRNKAQGDTLILPTQ